MKAPTRYLVLASALTMLLTAGGTTAGLAATGHFVPAADGERTAITGCQTPRSDFVTNGAAGLATSSATNTAIPGMTKWFWQAGDKPGCVIVHVSGWGAVGQPDSEEVEFEVMYVTVELDGGIAPSPVEVQWSGDDRNRAGHVRAAVFAFPSVSPGEHTVRMMFRTAFNTPVTIFTPAMHIQHR